MYKILTERSRKRREGTQKDIFALSWDTHRELQVAPPELICNVIVCVILFSQKWSEAIYCALIFVVLYW